MKTTLLTDRRQFLHSTSVATLGIGIIAPTSDVAWTLFGAPSKPSLGDLAAQKEVLYGSSVNKLHLSQDESFAKLIAQEDRLIVPEGELKWKALSPQPNNFNFDSGDWIVHWAESHNIKARGTALVWHEALPSWFDGYVNKSNAKELLVNYITTVLKHYRGKMHSWDVVNEPLTGNGLRETPWLRLLGPDYIELAFRTAAEVDPSTIWVLNDPNIKFS